MDVPLDEYSEYDDPRKRREIRSQYRNLMDTTQSKDYCDDKHSRHDKTWVIVNSFRLDFIGNQLKGINL